MNAETPILIVIAAITSAFATQVLPMLARPMLKGYWSFSMPKRVYNGVLFAVIYIALVCIVVAFQIWLFKILGWIY